MRNIHPHKRAQPIDSTVVFDFAVWYWQNNGCRYGMFCEFIGSILVVFEYPRYNEGIDRKSVV